MKSPSSFGEAGNHRSLHLSARHHWVLPGAAASRPGLDQPSHGENTEARAGGGRQPADPDRGAPAERPETRALPAQSRLHNVLSRGPALAGRAAINSSQPEAGRDGEEGEKAINEQEKQQPTTLLTSW